MRYRLLTLLILMTCTPVVAAVVWMFIAGRRVDPLLYLAASFVAMAGYVAVAMWIGDRRSLT